MTAVTTTSLGTAAKAMISSLYQCPQLAAALPGMVSSTVVAVESRLTSGTDKLTAVLNTVSAFIAKEAPLAGQQLLAFMAAVETFVNALVAVYNDIGVFIHALKTAAA